VKYVLMYTNRPDLTAAIPPERQAQVYGEIYGWFEKNESVFVENGAELQEITTATSVKSGEEGENPVVVDGPFNEAKEVIGGFSIIDVPDLDAAIELAKTWPSLAFPGVAVEIRPIVDHSGG
jgi:hypothetical protein